MIEDLKVYTKFKAHDVMQALPSYDFINNFVMPKIHESPTYNNPKYFYFASHQEQLMPLLTAFGMSLKSRSEPGGSLLLEVSVSDDQTPSITVNYADQEEIKDSKTYSTEQLASHLNKTFELFNLIFKTDTEEAPNI